MGIWSSVASGLLEYETQKVVQIHSKKIGVTFRLIQLGIILYVVLWVMIYEKGYQSFDQAVSGVTAKLKGIAFANVTDNPAIGASVWDAADYVIPPQQNSAFFVMTNLVSTPGQTLSCCEESHDVFGNNCTTDSDCTAGKLVMTGSGIQTGRCVPSTRQKNLKVCEIYGWCPTEFDITPKPHLLASAENFTVILKNSIEFPRYRVKRRNILSWMNKLFLKKCRYDPHDEKMKYCPIFRLGDILKFSGALDENIWRNGGMVSIHIEWNCNLDFDVEKCLPRYVFRRLDDSKSDVAKGWNFRFSHHYMENGVRKRNLVKAYGIQFFITVYGTGGKFNVLTFSMNLGSGLALLGIATVLCDMIILNATRKRGMYRRAKVDLIAQKKKLKKAQEELSVIYKKAKEYENKVNAQTKDGTTQCSESTSKVQFNEKDSGGDDDNDDNFNEDRRGQKDQCLKEEPIERKLVWHDKSCADCLKPIDYQRTGEIFPMVNQPSFLGLHSPLKCPDSSMIKSSNNTTRKSNQLPYTIYKDLGSSNHFLQTSENEKPTKTSVQFGPPRTRPRK